MCSAATKSGRSRLTSTCSRRAPSTGQPWNGARSPLLLLFSLCCFCVCLFCIAPSDVPEEDGRDDVHPLHVGMILGGARHCRYSRDVPRQKIENRGAFVVPGSWILAGDTQGQDTPQTLTGSTTREKGNMGPSYVGCLSVEWSQLTQCHNLVWVHYMILTQVQCMS